jgi:hypothetical protein
MSKIWSAQLCYVMLCCRPPAGRRHCYYFYGLFDDAVSSSKCVGSYDGMVDEK